MIQLLTLLFAPLLAGGATASNWTPQAEVHQRTKTVVTYRARLDGDVLFVEAVHAPGWHTYALDNVQRARAKTGKRHPETELPTRVHVSGGLKPAGSWWQSNPKDLSQPAIQWYTWGFDETARFAVRVVRTPGDAALITINGQACNDSSCSMVRDVRIRLPLAAPTELSPSTAFPDAIEAGVLIRVSPDTPNETPPASAASSGQ